MATHEIKADLDVDGEVQGTSLDINGNADIAGNLNMSNHTLTANLVESSEFRLDTLGDAITFYGGGQLQHSIMARDASGTAADDLRINSYGAVYVNLDSNNNNTSAADFVIGNHGDATGTINTLFTLSGEDGDATFTGTIGSGAITSTGKITGTELEGTSLDINGAADISGTLTLGGDVTIINSIIHAGDTDTYFGFHNANEWRVVTGGTERFEITNSGATFAGNIAVGGTVDGVDIATRDGILSGTTITAQAALPKAGGTMAGPIAMGSQNITGAGTITGTTLTGTSLDINGNADISGNLTGVDTLTATTLSVTNYGLASADIPNNAADTSGNADTADTALEATNVTATANNSANETVYPTFVDGPSGAQGIETDTGLHYNPSSGMLTAAGFTGALTGNASGSSGSCTGNAATATLAATSTIASDTGSATHFPVFVDGSTGSRALKAHSSWNYNPGTSTLTAGKLTTDVAAIVEDNKSNSALMTLTGQGAGDEGNVSLKMLGTSAGNPIKLKMAGLDDNGSQAGAGFLSYDAEDDSFGIGQSSSHNRMGVKIENTISLSSPDVHYEPVSIKAREFVATSNSTHYDFYGDIIRNGNDTTTRGKLYVYKNGTWTITNADTKLDANGLLGLAIGTNSTTHGMLLRGTFTLDYDPGGNGNPLYISTTDGVMSTTVPSTSGHIVRLVGYLLGGTHGNMFFDPDKTYIEVA